MRSEDEEVLSSVQDAAAAAADQMPLLPADGDKLAAPHRARRRRVDDLYFSAEVFLNIS
jgi:hypothetical protein